MADARLVEDRLRAEYVSLLPAMKRILVSLETEIRYLLLPLIMELDRHEQIVVRARLKDCESAVDSLRRRQELRVFKPDRAELYSLTALPDLIALRVMTFPGSRFRDADRIIRHRIPDWTADPVLAGKSPIAHKYHGFWSPGDRLRSEVQVVSLLVSLFWQVEHSAIYKPSDEARRAAGSLRMKERTAAVISALQQFEAEFDWQLDQP